MGTDTQVKMTLAHRDPEKLEKHPLNLKLYGDLLDQEFHETCKHGIDEPIIVVLIGKKEVILSGHRRHQSARIWGHKSVPVIIRYDLTDPLDIEEALIRANKQREKTPEQRAREYERLKEIESEKAARRVAATQAKAGEKIGSKATKTVTEPTNSEKKGEAAAIAAEAVGMSRPTAEAALKAVKAIDEAEAKGDTETAETIRTTLNTKGAKPAAKIADKSKPKEPGINPRLDFDDKQVDRDFGCLVRTIDRRAEVLKCQNSPRHKACLDHLNSFIEEFNEWKAERR